MVFCLSRECPKYKTCTRAYDNFRGFCLWAHFLASYDDCSFVNESGKMVRTEKKFWCGPNGNYAMFIPFTSNEDYWTMDDPDE